MYYLNLKSYLEHKQDNICVEGQDGVDMQYIPSDCSQGHWYLVL